MVDTSEPMSAVTAFAQSFASGMAMLSASESSTRAIDRTMKRAASRPGSGGSSACAEAVEQHFSPDGRGCDICKEKDSSACPVFPRRFRRWFYPPMNGKTQGSICWFCGRVWKGKFKFAFATTTLYVEAVGGSNELREEHIALMKVLIEACSKAGTYEVKISWSSTALATEVTSTERRRQSIEDEDLHVEFEYYKSEYKGGMGDPATNGRNHRVGWCDGVFGVFVPGAPIKRIKRAKDLIVDRNEVHDTGDLQFTPEHMTEIANTIFQGFAMASFSGTHAGALPDARLVAASPASKPTPAVVEAPLSSPQKGPETSFFGVNFGSTRDSPGKEPTGDARGNQGIQQPASMQPVKKEQVSRQMDLKIAKRGRGAGGAAADKRQGHASSSGSQQSLAGGSAGLAAMTKGRPKRNVVADAQKVIGEFKVASAGDKSFFGTGQKSLIQWLQRLVEAFDERLQEPAITQEFKTELILHKKMIEVVVALCKAARKSGVESDDFLEVAYQQVQFMDMPPRIETNIFPTLVRMAAKKSVVERAKCGSEWWESLSPTSLSFGDSAINMGELASMQEELIANKIVAIQHQSKSEFHSDLDKLFGDMEAMKKAQLSATALEESLAVAMVAQVFSHKVALHTEEALKNFDNAIALVKDTKKAIASSLVLYPAGRDLVARAGDVKLKLIADVAKQQELQVGAEQCESFKDLATKAMELDAGDCRPVRAAFVTLGVSVSKFPDFKMDDPEGMAPRIKKVVGTWISAVSCASSGYLGRCLTGAPFEEERRDEIKKLVVVMQGFADLGSGSEDHRSALPALRQAASLLDSVPVGLAIVEKATKEDLTVDDCKFLQLKFQNFSMVEEWAKLMVDPNTEQACEACSRMKLEFEAQVTLKLWSASLRAKVLKVSMAANGLQARLQKFLGCLPTEYKTCTLPAVFDAIPDDGLIDLLVTSGDDKLCKQVNYMCSHHGVLMAAAECAMLRDSKCTPGVVGGNMVLDSKHVLVVSSLRKALSHARLHAPSADGEGDIFQSDSTDESKTLHCDILDKFLNAVNFSAFVFEKCEAELSIWQSAYTGVVEKYTTEIEDAVPKGWQVHKDTLLENKETVALLVSNKDYLKLCSAVSKLGECIEHLRVLGSDGCGAFFTIPELKQRSNKAIEMGTDTVAVTFAAYQLTVTIPKLKKADRVTAVDNTKAAMKAKRATMGKSLEDECIRLLS